MSEQTKKLAKYMKSDTVVASFSDVVGSENRAMAYVASVLIAVRNNDYLANCTHASIYTAALQCATLRLSVDPQIGQAALVPFKDKCTLVIMWRGLRELGLRTGNYRYLNVSKIYEGEEIIEDRLKGIHRMEGGKASNEVIGYLGYMEMINGYVKTIYMSKEDIHAHGTRYSKTYDNKKGMWKKNPSAMEKKTVWRMLLKEGTFSPADKYILDEIDLIPLPDSAAVDAEFLEGEVIDDGPPPSAEDEINALMGGQQTGSDYRKEKEAAQDGPEKIKITDADRPKDAKDWKGFYEFATRFLSKDDVAAWVGKRTNAMKAFEDFIKRDDLQGFID